MKLTYSVCNELFGDLPLPRAARIIRESGYTGIEFAPFTIFGDFSPGSVRDGLAEARDVLDGEGLSFAGFHWLLAKPEGLHLASPDPAVRSRSVDHLRFLADCAGRLGGGPLILGSPRQRGSLPEVPKAEAEAALDRALREAAPAVEAAGCSLLLESLSPEQTDVVNSLAEAVRRARAAGSPAVSSMFDFRNVSGEAEGWQALLDRHFGDIRHVHANEVDGRAPGTGSSDYLPAFRTLLARGYRGWVSVEIFEVPPDPGAILRGSMDLFKRLEEEGSR
ncbi:MAG TPA: sugar phosphate isomerase/epimerase [Spirochaetia bacterium]|nr:sugar phosphate isomerase/epimerase [Spirochaetales bacterium]HRY80672.1 sugar phosphate isomerase/epimerase [Spirochaetia bacterium]